MARGVWADGGAEKRRAAAIKAAATRKRMAALRAFAETGEPVAHADEIEELRGRDNGRVLQGGDIGALIDRIRNREKAGVPRETGGGE